LSSIVDLVFEQNLVNWFFSLLRKPMRTDLLLCDRWRNSAQAYTCCYKSDKQD